MQRIWRRFFSPEGLVMRIALPAIAEMVLTSLIGSLDTIMVGQPGKTALRLFFFSRRFSGGKWALKRV